MELDEASSSIASSIASSSTDGFGGAGGNARQMEDLNRGVVAVKVTGGVYVGWRMLGTDPTAVSFNVYRNGVKINASPITGSTNITDAAGATNSTYTVRPIVNGVEQAASETASVWAQNYLTIPLQTPAGYTPGDASVGDLDGDGQYEIVLKQEQTPKDNSQAGVTGQTLLEAYRLDGTFLWRINLGKNIREGAHYTQFIVYDLDGDGKAEVACKTADGTIDGKGTVIGNAGADYRNADGYILSGPEYLTVFEGLTGKALATKNYVPARGTVSSWGDSYGNRVDRFLAGVAYLDGTRPSLIMARGYYTRAVIAAWNFRDGVLSQVWTFDTENGNTQYRGQGNHNLSVGDVDGDGKDEIIYGAAAINDNGTGMYSTGLGHGDALHLSDMDPNHPGLEVFDCHETPSATAGLEYRDADSGQLLFGIPSTGDVGRALAMDVDPNHSGFEGWVAGGGISGMYNLATKTKISATAPAANFGVWWDADPLREILNGDIIDEWDYAAKKTNRLLTAYNYGAASNNGTKANPALSGDILGDWREEVIWRNANNQELLVFTTTIVTDRRIHTLMHDPQYRLSIAWQNVAYNQPPHTSFFLGHGMATPPRPSIYLP